MAVSSTGIAWLWEKVLEPFEDEVDDTLLCISVDETFGIFIMPIHEEFKGFFERLHLCILESKVIDVYSATCLECGQDLFDVVIVRG